MPLLCVHANIFAVSMLDGRPSREIVIGEGVRPTAVARWEVEGGSESSSVVLSLLESTFISESLVVTGSTRVTLFVGYALAGKKDVGLPLFELVKPALVDEMDCKR